MIYQEALEIEGLNIQIVRQKDTPDGCWYGILLCYVGDKIIADNSDFIATELYSMLIEGCYKRAMEELELPYNRREAKAIKRLIKKAYKLGWFSTV